MLLSPHLCYHAHWCLSAHDTSHDQVVNIDNDNANTLRFSSQCKLFMRIYFFWSSSYESGVIITCEGYLVHLTIMAIPLLCGEHFRRERASFKNEHEPQCIWVGLQTSVSLKEARSGCRRRRWGWVFRWEGTLQEPLHPHHCVFKTVIPKAMFWWFPLRGSLNVLSCYCKSAFLQRLC